MAEEEVRHGTATVQVPIEIVNTVRTLLSDFGVTNELVEGKEWSDEWIARNIVSVVADFNTVPPVLDEKVSVVALYSDSFADLKHWVEEAAVARILRFGSIRLARNALPYTAGSINYDPNAVWQNYKALGDELWQEWTVKRDQKKLSMNVDGGWGVANTDYLTRAIYDQGSVINVVGSIF